MHNRIMICTRVVKQHVTDISKGTYSQVDDDISRCHARTSTCIHTTRSDAIFLRRHAEFEGHILQCCLRLPAYNFEVMN